jgi:hypothetical protein
VYGSEPWSDPSSEELRLGELLVSRRLLPDTYSGFAENVPVPVVET